MHICMGYGYAILNLLCNCMAMYTVKVPKGISGSQIADDKHFFLPQQRYAKKLAILTAQYSMHDSSLSCVVFMLRNSLMFKFHGFVYMAARYQPIVL